MEHLRLALILMGLFSIVTFFVARRILWNATVHFLNAIAIIVLVLVWVYVRLVWGQLWIVNWIPLPSVIVLSNWFPILLAILAAILWLRMKNHPLWRRAPAQAALIGLTFWSIVYVLPARPPECRNEWIPASREVPFAICRQTTPDTCSAAASATILNQLGIASTEQEMARLCLTHQGTTWLGIYHGLSVKLLGTGFEVKFFRCEVSQLDAMTADYPALLCCELTEDVAARLPNYVNDEGWIPGQAHSVVLFGRRGDEFLIGDPSQEFPEVWSRRDLITLWTGTGLRITTTDDDAPRAPAQTGIPAE